MKTWALQVLILGLVVSVFLSFSSDCFYLSIKYFQVAATQAAQPGCYWSGTAPVCHGSCKTGEVVMGSSHVGEGATCVTGKKKLCCKPSVNLAATSPAATVLVAAPAPAPAAHVVVAAPAPAPAQTVLVAAPAPSPVILTSVQPQNQVIFVQPKKTNTIQFVPVVSG